MPCARTRAVTVVLAAVLACGPGDAGTTAGATTSTGSSTTAASSTTTTTGTTATTIAPTTTGTSTSTGELSSTATSSGDSGGFAVMPDMPPPMPIVPCDPWIDTCPEGQKCQPYEDGGGWAGGCMDVTEPPIPVGGQCNIHWGLLMDDCERGSTCFGLGLYAETYTCTPLATGSTDAPVCPDPCSHVFDYDGVFALCNPTCDPLAPDCGEDMICNPIAHRGKFMCTLAGTAAAGEVCVKTDDCVEGTACVTEFLLPACAGEFCCAPLCDLNAPDPCPAALANTTCQTWPPFPNLDAACLPPGLGMCTNWP